MSFCKSVRSKIKSILRKFDKEVEEHVDTALLVTTSIKKFLRSPVSDIINAIIPGQIDDLIRAKLLVILPYAIDTLTIIDHCKDAKTLNEKAACYIDQLKKVDPALQEAILHKLAAIITRELDGNKLAQSVYDLFVQAQYSVKK